LALPVHRDAAHRVLASFPTRRSSDLGEEHQTVAREDRVLRGRVEAMGLGVGFQKGDVRPAAGTVPGDGQERLRNVEPGHAPPGRGAFGGRESRRAGAAADVEDILAGADRGAVEKDRRRRCDQRIEPGMLRGPEAAGTGRPECRLRGIGGVRCGHRPFASCGPQPVIWTLPTSRAPFSDDNVCAFTSAVTSAFFSSASSLQAIWPECLPRMVTDSAVMTPCTWPATLTSTDFEVMSPVTLPFTSMSPSFDTTLPSMVRSSSITDFVISAPAWATPGPRARANVSTFATGEAAARQGCNRASRRQRRKGARPGRRLACPTVAA